MKKKAYGSLFTVFAALLIISLIAGCASGSPAAPESASAASPSGDSAEQSDPPAQSPDEQLTIRYMDNMASATSDAVYTELIASFNQTYPNVKIEYETVPWDQSHSKLVTLGATNSMPDVLQVHPTWIAEFVNSEWIVPLGAYLDTYEHKDGFTDYTKNVLLDQTQKQVYGDVYVIPDAILTNGFFVRTDWMEEAGVNTDDWTWNDFFDAAERLTDSEANRYGLSLRGGRSAYHQSQFLLLSVTGGRVFDENGVCLFNSPECVEIFSKYVDLYRNGYAPKDSIGWGFAEMVQGFTSGLTGMLNQTCEVIEMCEGSLEDDQWTVVSLPKSDVDGMIYNEASFSNGYAIAKNSSNPDVAWDLIGHLSAPESATLYGKANLLIPVMKEALQDPFFTDGKMAGYAEMFRKDNLVAWPELGYFPEVGEFRETFADPELQKCFMGEQTPQETLDKWAEFLTTNQQKYMQENPDVAVPAPKQASAFN